MFPHTFCGEGAIKDMHNYIVWLSFSGSFIKMSLGVERNLHMRDVVFEYDSTSSKYMKSPKISWMKDKI